MDNATIAVVFFFIGWISRGLRHILFCKHDNPPGVIGGRLISFYCFKRRRQAKGSN